MDLEKLKEEFNIKKVPTHPNESTYDEWLDVYESYSRLSSTIFDEGFQRELLNHIRERLSNEEFDDKEFYVLKMNLRELDEVVVRRRSVKNKRKNSKLSRIAKRRWRRNKYKYQRALKKFHKSSKGKDFHKSLGRHLRNSVERKSKNESQFEITDESLVELMLSINSAMTHIIIEFQQKVKNPEEYEDIDELDSSFIRMVNQLTGQMINDLTLALEEEGVDRYEIYHDVIYLAGEVLIPSGIQTNYVYEK